MNESTRKYIEHQGAKILCQTGDQVCIELGGARRIGVVRDDMDASRLLNEVMAQAVREANNA